MDIRRPARNPNAAARRHLFNAPRRPHTNSLGTAISTSSLHIAAEEADSNEDLAERDSSGSYVIAAPSVSYEQMDRTRAEMEEERGKAAFRM